MGGVLLHKMTFAIAWTLDWLLTAYFYIMLATVLLSWVNPDPYNPIVRFLRGVTEPVLYQVRRRLPFLATSGLDLSPIAVGLAIVIVRMVVVGSLYELADRFR